MLGVTLVVTPWISGVPRRRLRVAYKVAPCWCLEIRIREIRNGAIASVWVVVDS